MQSSAIVLVKLRHSGEVAYEAVGFSGQSPQQ